MPAKKREFKPLNKRVAVERFEPKTMTEGGLYIPDNAKDLPIGGRIVAVADGLDYPIGTIVLFGKYAGVEVSIDGEGLLLIKDEDLLGIIEN